MNSIGQTTLHVFCKRFNDNHSKTIEIGKLLISNGANLFFQDQAGKMPLEFLNQSKNNTLLEIILEKMKQSNQPQEQQLLLQFAYKFKLVDIVKYLLIEKDVVVQDLCKALQFALENKSLDLVKYLIEAKGANFLIVDANQNTALHYACHLQSCDIVKYLIEEKKLDPNIIDNNGKTALHILCGRKELNLENGKNIVNILIDNRANLFMTDNDGKFPFDLISKDEKQFYDFLLEKMSKSHKPEDCKVTFISACAIQSINVVKYLNDEKKIDLWKTDKDQNTVLHHACESKSYDLVEYLIENSSSQLNSTNNNGQTPLHIFCKTNKRSSNEDMEIEKLLCTTDNLFIQDCKEKMPIEYVSLSV